MEEVSAEKPGLRAEPLAVDLFSVLLCRRLEWEWETSTEFLAKAKGAASSVLLLRSFNSVRNYELWGKVSDRNTLSNDCAAQRLGTCHYIQMRLQVSRIDGFLCV